MAILLNSLKKAIAQSFLNDIYTKQSRLYFYFGQINSFGSDSVEEASSIDYVNQTKNNIVAIKEVLPSDASFIVQRKDYLPNKLYKRWNTSGDSWDYVYNASNFSIYICVDAPDSNSTEIPTHTTITPVTYSDGYTWRYIYTVPLALRDRFLTPEWVPVSNNLTENYFSDGGITSVSILSPGEGYDKSSTYHIS